MPKAVKSPRKSAVSKKSSTATTAPASAKKAPAKKKAAANNHFHPGTYTVPRGHVSIAVPTFWSLRQTNDDIQVESEQSETTVIVTAYQRNPGVKALDAREYLTHFLETTGKVQQLKHLDAGRQKSSARFRDAEGDNWHVAFFTNGETLLLGTCHSNRPLNSREGHTGVAVLESIKLKKAKG
jgi:hypothetical protein